MPTTTQFQSIRKTFLYQPGFWLFAILLASYAYFFPRWADWGQNSKLDLTMAIVDRGTFTIDNYYTNTGDYALYKSHHYSDKAPGASFLGVPFYTAFKAIASTSLMERLINQLASNPAMTETLREGGTGLLRDKVYAAMALYVITFFVNVLSSALLGYILYRFLGYFIEASTPRLLVVFLYGLGTVAFPYSQTLNGRQIAAVLVLSTFYLLFRIRVGVLSERYLWLVGFLMGYALISDYPSILILGALFLYAIVVLRNVRRILPIVLAALPPILLMMYYNLSCFETVLPVGYKYSELYQDLHSQGFISITYPRLDALFGLTFSPFRGAFFLSPALLLAIPGYIYWYRRGIFRAEWWVSLWSVVITFLFYGSSVMWWGGFAVGPAYLTAMFPMLVIPIVFFTGHPHKSQWVKAIILLLIILSIALVWMETIAGQSFPDMAPNPLFQLSIPALAAGNIARNLGMIIKLRGWASLLPLASFLVLALIFIVRSSMIFNKNNKPS
jgi:hypothetical protein